MVSIIMNMITNKGENMKKILYSAVAAMMIVPATYAAEITTPETITENTSDTAIAEKTSREWLHGVQVGLGASATSGLNGFVGYANKDFDSFWLKRFGFRVDFASTRPVKSAINSAVDSAMGSSGIDIGDNLTINDGEIKAHHVAALVDFYPFGNTWFWGGLRLTGGYYTGKLDVDANLSGKIDGLPSDAFEFKLMDNLYRYTGNSVHGTARADWKYSGPYLGTGFDLGLFAGFKIYMDAGVVFTSKTAQLNLDVPFAGLEYYDTAASTWKPVSSSAEQAEVDRVKAEALADAQSELDDIKFYPMIKLGFMYRF